MTSLIWRHSDFADRYGGHERRPLVPVTRALTWVLPGMAMLLFLVWDANGVKGEVYQLKSGGDLLQVDLIVNKTETIWLNTPVSEVLIGNSTIADVVPLTEKSIYIFGKKIGRTRVTILDLDKAPVGIIDVKVDYDISALEARLSHFVPGSNLQVSSVGSNLLLTGQVKNARDISLALALAQQVAGKNVTNAMTVTSPQQVMLEVRFVEANRDAQRDLGVSTVHRDKAGGDLKGLTTERFSQFADSGVTQLFSNLVSGSMPFGMLVSDIVAGGTNIEIIIQALEERGLARRLAEPNLVALSGDTASFLAGGEFPFPIQTPDGQVSVQFKKFGVGLTFTPTVIADGLINLKIEPEVSEIDPINAVTVGGVNVPSLSVRRAQTTIELRDGQSFAIAGLLSTSHTKLVRQLPWLGQVPVLGTLFRSASYSKKETDLVIIVTPRLVSPRKPGEALRTPLDDKIASNDLEFFLQGRNEWDAPGIKPSHGHILSLGTQEIPVNRSREGRHGKQ